MSGSADRRLERASRRRLGLFTLADARTAGVAPSTVYDRATSGRYVQRQPRVFAHAPVPDSRVGRYLAAVLAVSTDEDPAVLSHVSAAHLWGFEVGPDEVIHVVSRTHHPARVDGVRAHRTRALPAHHRTERSGIPVTTPERTLCELASCVGYEVLRRAVASAVRRKLTTTTSLAATLFELGRIRGKRDLRRILAELSPLERDAREGLEALFLRVTTWAGIPPSAMNHPTRDAEGRRRLLDAVYLPDDHETERPVWVELDSERFHSSPLDVADDRRREASLVAAGWPPPLRYTWADLVERTDEVIAELLDVLGRRVAAGSDQPE